MYALTAIAGRFHSSAVRATNLEAPAWETMLNLGSGVRISERELTSPLTRATVITEHIYKQTGEEMSGLATQMAAGELSGQEYKEGRARILSRHFEDLTRERTTSLGIDLRVNPRDSKAIAEKRALLDFARQQLMGDELAAIEAYFAISPDDVGPDNKLVYDNGLGQVDWDAFYADRDAQLEEIRSYGGDAMVEEVRTKYLQKFPAIVQQVEVERMAALDKYREYHEMPRYPGITPEQERRIRLVNAAVNTRAFEFRGLPNARRRAEALYRQQTGDQEGVTLARAASRKRNRARSTFFRANAAEFQRWFGSVALQEEVAELQEAVGNIGQNQGQAVAG